MELKDLVGIHTDILVECKMRENNHAGQWCEEVNDILEFYDINNGEMFMAVGTANTDDYYPYFVFEYTPEVLSRNNKNILILCAKKEDI